MSATGSKRTMWDASLGSFVEQAMYASSPPTVTSLMRSGTVVVLPAPAHAACSTSASSARRARRAFIAFY